MKISTKAPVKALDVLGFLKNLMMMVEGNKDFYLTKGLHYAAKIIVKGN